MTKSLAMLFFMLSVTMFSIGLYRYQMKFDAAVPPPYPPFTTPAFAEMQRREALGLDDDDDDAIITSHASPVIDVDVHHCDCD